VTVILTLVGFIAYVFAPRHDAPVGAAAKLPVKDVTLPDDAMSE